MTAFGKAATTASAEFISHVRLLFALSLEHLAERPDGKSGAACHLAIPAYISAVAAVESFVNEWLLSDLAGMTLGGSAIPTDLQPLLEYAELDKKLLLVPQIAFGRTFSRGTPPYQDMAMLIKVRNELVHYKMNLDAPTFVRDLAQRGIAVRVPREQEAGGPMPWLDRVATIQGIQWAHNSACATVRELIEMSGRLDLLPIADYRANFAESNERVIASALTTAGIGPTPPASSRES